MSTNRHLVNDREIIRPTQLLDRGLPLPGLDGRYVVEHGWCAIITLDGVYQETLGPGKHHLGRYPFWRDVKATAIDTRLRTLTVATTREFTIAQPVPVEINLDLSAEYQVTDARRVALEVNQPLTALFDRVVQAVRGAVVHATIEEIRRQGETIAQTTLQRLHALQLPKILGIEVLNVLVTSIKATDTGSDALANRQMEEMTRLRDWQLDNVMLAGSQITPAWLAVNRPELLQEMIAKGALDPAAVLSHPLGAAPADAGALASGLLGGFPGMPTPALGNQATAGVPGAAQLPAAGAGRAPQDIHARMREEVGYLQKLPGARVETRPGVDASGIPDGSYDVQVALPRSSGGTLTLFAVCPAGYPRQPPSIDVDLDDQATAFPSSVVRHWTGQHYLVEIAREARQYFG